jgi:NAD(P)-dependent dehydrogenase (short-subunit alcohol dehydrogenase family)
MMATHSEEEATGSLRGRARCRENGSLFDSYARQWHTQAQVLEWAPFGVYVNAIAPGIFPDPVTAGEERARQTADRAAHLVPLRGAGRLREVGFLALYLASAASDYMTGQTIFLDGGRSL